MLEAYQVLQDETCGECGQPIWLCHSDDPNIQWSVKSNTCYATKALREWQDAQNKSKGKNSKPKHGQQPYVVPFVLKYENGKPVEDYESLPTREEFFKQKAEENG